MGREQKTGEVVTKRKPKSHHRKRGQLTRIEAWVECYRRLRRDLPGKLIGPPGEFCPEEIINLIDVQCEDLAALRKWRAHEKQLKRAKLAAQVADLSTRLKKEHVKRDCGHGVEHQYETHRMAHGKHFRVVKCGYCGLELSGKEISTKAASVLSGYDVRGKPRAPAHELGAMRRALEGILVVTGKYKECQRISGSGAHRIQELASKALSAVKG